MAYGKQLNALRCLLAGALVGAAVPAMSDASAVDTSAAQNLASSAAYAPIFSTKLLWGDTHLHTAHSADANTTGNMRLGPETAYRFARGEVVTATNGMRARLRRPLDFLVIADHAEYLGLLPELRADINAVALSEQGRSWAERFTGDPGEAIPAALELVRSMSDAKPIIENSDINSSAWKFNVDAADGANEPGVFTALTGFEWTSMPGGNNLHRVVMFRDGGDRTAQVMPFSAFDSTDPEDLWAYMAGYERKTGGSVLAIPHNGNLSNGLMFSEMRLNGLPIDTAYSSSRQRWEPVVEVTQIKGDGEAHPFLSANDEFANYGTWDKGNLDSTAAKDASMLKYEYAREALKTGLSLESKTGVNPYKFGMIGSTDAHTSLSTADEQNFWGKAPPWEPAAERRIDVPFMDYSALGGEQIMGWEQVAGGYAAVWAKDNTRESIFDAFQRKEVYATTGSRISVRFFAGWDYKEGLIQRSDFVEKAYEAGVPMGGDLPVRPTASESPAFLIAAMKDPDGANLDRVQVVKGWIDAEGVTHERVFDVLWSGSREIGADGKLRAVGTTVDVKDGSYSNSIGTPVLSGEWRDPAFDSSQSSFYYVRVLEIPTPRWVLFDKLRLGADLGDEVALTHQERAYTSPIWFNAE